MRIIEIKNKLIDAMDAIHAYPRAAALSAQLFDLADAAGDGVEHPYDAARRDLGLLIAAARRTCRELKSLREHQHEWNSDGYCVHCHADGRA